MAAQADAAFHVALHGHVDLRRLKPVVHEFQYGEAHHHPGAADQGHGAGGIKPGPGDDLGHHPHIAVPITFRLVHRHVHPEVEAAAPALQFLGVEQVLGSPGAVDHLDIAELAPMLEQVIQGRPQGRQPQAPGDNQDVLARHPVHRPGDPEGTPHSQNLSPFQAADGPGDVPHVADGVHQGSRASRIAADGDGHLAGPEDIEHVELARGKGKVRRPLGPGQLQGIGVGGLPLHFLDHKRGR